MVIISVFQTDDAGSIPVIRSKIKKGVRVKWSLPAAIPIYRDGGGGARSKRKSTFDLEIISALCYIKA